MNDYDRTGDDHDIRGVGPAWRAHRLRTGSRRHPCCGWGRPRRCPEPGAAPGADQEILEGIPPTYDALTAVGQTRQLPGSLWIAVDYEGTEGWVNLTFIGYLGDTTDITHTVTEQLGGTSGAETMLELGLIVAEGVAGDTSADIVMSVAPTVGDLGEVTFDVTGFEDDSVRGSRLHVFGQPIDEAFLLASVEETVICGRGVDAGACV